MSSLRQPPAQSAPSLRDRMTNSLRGWVTGIPNRERANPGAAPASARAPVEPAPAPAEADTPRAAPPGFVFRDGGEVPATSLRGLHQRAVSGLSSLMERAAPLRTAPPPVMTPPPVAAPTPAPAAAPAGLGQISDYARGGAMQRREAQYGLQDGGDVPGRGRGDKVPALYEPGEFVVSNDMLNQAPGLRESLHGLRAQTLAAQGRTVAEADDGVLRGKALKARDGYEDQIPTDGYSPAPAADGSQDDLMNTEAGRNLRNLSMAVPGALGAGRVVGAVQSAANAASAPQRAITAGRAVAAAAAPAAAAAAPAPATTTAPAPSTDMAGPGQPAAASATPAQGLRPPGMGPYLATDERGPSILGAGPEQSEAQRVAAGRAAFATDKVVGDQMETDRMAAEQAGARGQEAVMRLNEQIGLEDDLKTRRWNASVERSKISGTARERQARTAAANAELSHLDTVQGQAAGLRAQERNNIRTTDAANEAAQLRAGAATAGAKAASVKALRDQFNDDRKFAADRADKAFEQSGKMDEQARAAFKDRFTKVVDGKSVERPDLEQAAYASAVRASGGKWSQLSPAERAQSLSDAGDYVDLLSAARDRQNNGWLQAIGWDPADPRVDQLPDLAGSRLTTVGAWEGMRTPNTEGGDYALRLKDGRTMYLARDQLGTGALGYLKRNGAKIGE